MIINREYSVYLYYFIKKNSYYEVVPPFKNLYSFFFFFWLYHCLDFRFSNGKGIKGN